MPDIKVPNSAKSNLELTCNHEKQDFKNVTELIDEIYKNVTNNKLNNFKSKMKIK